MATVTEVFGDEIMDRLARWAIDVACEPDESIEGATVTLSAARIDEGRAILEDAGINWRKLKELGSVSGESRPRKRVTINFTVRRA